MLPWRDLAAVPSNDSPPSRPPTQVRARAGGRRLSTARRSRDSHTV
jgi:hypothetical protein